MQSQRPVMSQEMRQKLSPQLLQSIQLMALPIVELRTRIQEEIEKNPALEVLEEPQDYSIEEADTENRRSEEEPYFDDSSDPGFGRGYDDEGADQKQRFLEGVLTRPESLQEHLLHQLELQPVSGRLKKLGELIIHNLDENGFHREDPFTLVKPADKSALEEALALVQQFDPAGVAVANYRESLILQTKLDGTAPELTESILQNDLELLEKGKIKELSKKYHTDEDEIREILEFVKTLTPFPGRLYSSASPTYVIPDVMVQVREGQFVIILNDEEIPVLGVNPFFMEPAREKDPKPVQNYVKENVRNARWFIQSIQQRSNTMLKVSKAIIEFQRDFFLRGAKALRPLTLKDVAAEIGVHEATVSRVTSGKYMQTEWGIFELKYFFTNAVSLSSTGGTAEFSKTGVMQVVREIIESHQGGKNLSDQKITELLAARGIKLARRTVAKYRGELDISSSFERNERRQES